MECEKVKYSKDKEGYSRFISGLVKNRSTSKLFGTTLDSSSTDQLKTVTFNDSKSVVLQEITLLKQNTSSATKTTSSSEHKRKKSAAA